MKSQQFILHFHLQRWYLVPFQEYRDVPKVFTATWLFLTIRASW